MIEGIKLIRLRKTKIYLRKFLEKFHIGIEIVKLMLNLSQLFLLIHVLANFWAAVANSQELPVTWMITDHI